MSGPSADQQDRAAGSLWGLAIGDALGMPTQLLSRDAVAETFGDIERFEEPTVDHPIASGLAAGTVTDDTQQTLLLAQALGPGAHIDQQAWADALLGWEIEARARGSLDLLGPSTRAALSALRAGTSPGEAGRSGTTNGAAMRICPVGIAVDASDPSRLVDRVVEASMLTHNTVVALAGAAAVAGAVSCCLDGADVAEAVSFAVHVADLAAARGHWVAGASVARRIDWAVGEARGLPTKGLSDFVVDVVGTSLATQESVPAAFALVAAFHNDPWRALCTAAQLGGDADTIAAMVGSMVGAACGQTALPAWAVRLVADVNHLDMNPVARRLLEIRCG